MKKPIKNKPARIAAESHSNLEEMIRLRAYELYQLRGRDGGHELDDWLRAEARLQKEAEAATAQARREIEAKCEQQILVLKKDAEAEKRLSELRIKTLEETLARQEVQIQILEKQLAEAKQQVQDMAIKTIEGPPGAKTPAHSNQIALE